MTSYTIIDPSDENVLSVEDLCELFIEETEVEDYEIETVELDGEEDDEMVALVREKVENVEVVGQKSFDSSNNLKRKSTDGEVTTPCSTEREIQTPSKRIQVCPPEIVRTNDEWKIVDELFADETNSTVQIPSKHKKTIFNFPDEVIEEIMKNLVSIDRKNTKLVCKRWFTIYSRIFDDKERICISLHNDAHFDEVLSVLMKSTRRCFHLEFYGSDWSDKPRASFWKACGPNILSLKLFYCHLSSPPFASILKFCSNLHSLELHFRSIHFDLRKKMRILNPNKTLDDLQIRSLKTLKVSFCLDQNYLINRLFVTHLAGRFFRFFPNVENFSLYHRSLLEDTWFKSSTVGNFYDEDYSDRVARSKVPQYFVRQEMRQVAINYYLCPGLEWNTFLSGAAELTKFTEIAVDIGSTIDLESFKKFAQKQIYLKSITCFATKRIRETLLIESVEVFWKIPTLREFQLIYRNVIHWNASFTNLLNASRVETMRIFCREISFSKMTIKAQVLNDQLVRLAVQAIKPYDSSIVSMLNAYPNLRELYLSHVNGVILESICTNQVKLQSFHVQSVMGGLDSLDCIHQLKQLRRLEVPQTDFPLRVNDFSHLKHLHVCRSYLHKAWNESSIVDGMSFDLKNLQTFSCPSLETIRLDCHMKADDPFQFVETVAEFVGGLKYLKFLSFCRFEGLPVIPTKDLRSIFQRCPSLGVLIVGNKAYFNDVIEKNIRGFYKKSNWDSNFNEYDLVEKYMDAENDRHHWDFFFHKSSINLYQPGTF